MSLGNELLGGTWRGALRNLLYGTRTPKKIHLKWRLPWLLGMAGALKNLWHLKMVVLACGWCLEVWSNTPTVVGVGGFVVVI